MAPGEDTLGKLQAWYAAQCDGGWEHQYGISIGTLDNPGWSLKVDLNETYLSGREFERVDSKTESSDWHVCWVANEAFEGAAGPDGLAILIDIFLKWATPD